MGGRGAAHVSRPQRAGDGACGDRLRQGQPPATGVCLHHLDRARRAEHGHRRGGRAREPAAGAVPARRRLRRARPRSGAAAGGGLCRRDGLGKRLFPARLALFRPRAAAGAADRLRAAGDRDHARSGDVRTGDARLLPGRADRSLRLPGELLRAPRLAHSPSAPRPPRARRTGRAAVRGALAAGHRRRRGDLFRRGERAGGAGGTSRHPRRRDPGRAGRDGGRPPAGVGRDRRDRDQRRERRCGRGRPRHRGRHATDGLHHRLARPVRGRGAARSGERRRLRRGQAKRAGCGRRRASGARSAQGQARRSRGAPAARGQSIGRWKATWDADWDAATRAPAGNTLPSDAQVIGAVWRESAENGVVVCAAGGLPGELHRLWRPRARSAATTSSTASLAWATRSPAASA